MGGQDLVLLFSSIQLLSQDAGQIAFPRRLAPAISPACNPSEDPGNSDQRPRLYVTAASRHELDMMCQCRGTSESQARLLRTLGVLADVQYWHSHVGW